MRMLTPGSSPPRACAASCIDTERSQYSTPYFSRILKPSSSHAPGMRKIAIFSAGSKPSSRHAFTTPRATMSTRVLDTIDIITAILSTPGLESTSFARPGRLRDRRVAADLAVVRRLAAVLAHRVEQGEAAAARADHEAEVAVELGHVAGHAAVVHRVDLLAGDLERSGLACLARLLVADAELLQQRLLARARLVLHLHVRVEGDEAAVLELAQRVDLGEGHVVLAEQAREAREDRRRARQLTAGHAGLRDRPPWRGSRAPRRGSRGARARRGRDAAR